MASMSKPKNLYRVDGAKVVQLRRSKFMTAEEVAKAAGLGVATVVRLELGTAEARTDTLRKLATGLGVRPQDLLTADDPASQGGE